MRCFGAVSAHLQERICVPRAALGGKKDQEEEKDPGRIWEGSRKDHILQVPRAAPSHCPHSTGTNTSPIHRDLPSKAKNFTFSCKPRLCGKGSCNQFTADTPGCGNTLFIRSIFHLSNTVTEYHNAGYKHRMAPWAQRRAGRGGEQNLRPDTTERRGLQGLVMSKILFI